LLPSFLKLNFNTSTSHSKTIAQHHVFLKFSDDIEVKF